MDAVASTKSFSQFLIIGKKQKQNKKTPHMGFVLHDRSDWWWKTEGHLLDVGPTDAGQDRKSVV